MGILALCEAAARGKSRRTDSACQGSNGSHWLWSMTAWGQTRRVQPVLPTPRLPLYIVGDQTRAALNVMRRASRISFNDLLSPRDDEPGYSITSSARPSSGSGIVRPSVLAVLRLVWERPFRALSAPEPDNIRPLRPMTSECRLGTAPDNLSTLAAPCSHVREICDNQADLPVAHLVCGKTWHLHGGPNANRSRVAN